MSRSPRIEPSLAEWAALGLLCESARHGWVIAGDLASAGEIGQIYSRTRPLLYRALGGLRESGLVEARGTTASDEGPARTMLAATRRGLAAFRRWRGAPVEHVRDLRSELMLKLFFHERGGDDPAPLLRAQAAPLSKAELAPEAQARSSEAFDQTLVLWRLSVARSALSFVEALLQLAPGRAGRLPTIGMVLSPHWSRRHAAPADRGLGG